MQKYNHNVQMGHLISDASIQLPAYYQPVTCLRPAKDQYPGMLSPPTIFQFQGLTRRWRYILNNYGQTKT